jgi:hypothetical protein
MSRRAGRCLHGVAARRQRGTGPLVRMIAEYGTLPVAQSITCRAEAF